MLAGDAVALRVVREMQPMGAPMPHRDAPSVGRPQARPAVVGKLREFIQANRDEILSRARSRVRGRSSPVASETELIQALPSFLDQLGEALRRASAHDSIDHADITATASMHGGQRFQQGLTVAQVVHDYGDLCQVITGLAVEQKVALSVYDFQTLNLCLDDAIAGAVTSFAQQRELTISDEGTERLGVLAHELRNVLGAATLSFASIKKGVVSAGGSTGAVHERSLLRMQALIDRSLAEVRLDAGMQHLEAVSIWQVLEETEISGSMLAQTRDITLVVTTIAQAVQVRADRQILCAMVSNLLQNAFKFSPRGATVHLRAACSANRVLIEVEDQCGGLPAGKPESLLRPFNQQGTDRTGLGLGLSICIKAAHSFSGDLRIRDLPGKGCVFTIDLPRVQPGRAS
jgi:signal transduction histidine kinase